MTWVSAALTGQRFGRLLVRESLPERTADGRVQWSCECDCGGMITATTSVLRNTSVRSCGCLVGDTNRALRRTHGLRNTPEYMAIVQAKNRCNNTHAHAYQRYGGRGVEYKLPDNPGEAAALVIASIGSRPSGPPRMTLDRINNDGPYAIGNLRWATYSQQRRNQSR